MSSFFDVTFLEAAAVTGMVGVLFGILVTVNAFAVSYRKTVDTNRDSGCPVHNLQDCQESS